MIKHSLFLFIALLFLCACSPQSEGELPTLAVLPTLEPTLTPVPIRPLEFWQAVSGTLATTAQVDRWQFSGQAGDAISLRALGPVSLSLERDGTIIAPAGNATIEVRLPESGDYLVRVRLTEGENTGYELGLGYTDRPNPASFTATPPPQTVGVPTPTPPLAKLGEFIDTLENGANIGGVFEDLLQTSSHVYRFEGTSGDYINLSMSRVSGDIDPLLRLFSPTGELLAVDDNTGVNRAALLRNILLRQDGTYTVQAASGDFTGAYQIALLSGDQPLPVTPTLIPQPTRQVIGTPVNPTPATLRFNGNLENQVAAQGSISRPGFIQRFFFQAEPGDFATVGVRAEDPASLQPFVEIVNPEGEILRSASANDANANGEALITLLPITEPERYTVMVSAPEDQTGDFIITYGTGNARESVLRGEAQNNTPYDGLISRLGLQEVWQLQLYEGDVITATANPLNNTLDPVLELVAPDGTVVATDDNGGGFPVPLFSDIRVPTSGIYELRVTGANAGSIGPYRLVWRYETVAPTFTPDPPRYLLMSVDDEINEGQYQFYPFQAQEGQRLRINVIAQPGSGLDPVAVLLDENGSEIAQGDDSETDLNPRFMVRIPADGTYTLRVNGYLSGGRFEVLVEALY